MQSNDILETNDNELIMLYREDDEYAKNILYLKYKIIIDILIKKYSKYIVDSNIDFQEVYSECALGFSDGLKSYKDDKNASLATFITLCVERKIKSIIRKYNREKYRLLLDTYSLDFIYENNDYNLLDILGSDTNDPLKNMTEEEKYEELLELISSKLTKNEYDVFTLMIRGLNYIEISKILNKTPKQIDNAIQRIRKKVRMLL